ncbi:laccase precursor [Mycena rosella]|uniref:Laccase n=1 Tax=Mycena rosella TaxID=1033263 RepID=A0AAD7D8V2_MYCRO|nr:laccase precursor [Mycena rosella]
MSDSLSTSPAVLEVVEALFISLLSQPIGPSTSLEITNKVISSDVQVGAILAGGTFPGPLIQGKKGDHFRIDVVNRLTDTTMPTSTSIHYHGLFHHRTSHSDGAAFVTQCPISPGHSFLYEFDVLGFLSALMSCPGTFWYHSHLSDQQCDGLRGPFVIYDPADPAAHLYETTIITLADWYNASSLLALKFKSTLINGLGRYAGGPLSKLAVVRVVHGQRYRFRLISMSCDATFEFSIDHHPISILEVDGINHQALAVDSIEIFPGQRYSFVLHAGEEIDNYWIRSPPPVKPASQPDVFANATNSAILRYVGAPDVDPTTQSSGSRALVETDLHPLLPSPVPGAHIPGGADINLHFDITRNMTTLKWFTNGVNYAPPSVPVLLQILSGAQKAEELLPKGSVYPLPPNKHPFHLHGHTFHVVRSAGNATYNFDNPVVRDVVSMGGSTDDLTTFRFTTDNPGPWFLHCHVDWHLEDGMALIFVEDVDAVAHQKPPQISAAWDQLCPIYDGGVRV